MERTAFEQEHPSRGLIAYQRGCVKQEMQGRPQRLGTGPAEEFGLYLEGLLDGRGEKCIPDFALCLLGSSGAAWIIGWGSIKDFKEESEIWSGVHLRESLWEPW